MTDYLINELYLKDTINVSAGLDTATINRSIKQVNRLYIQELLGVTLVDYLVDNLATLTPIYSDLLADVKYYFALLVQYDLLSSLGIKTTNKSAAQQADATADIASIKLQMKFIEEKYLRLKDDILAYLTKNANEIPEYIPQVSNKKFTGISFTSVRNVIYGG